MYEVKYNQVMRTLATALGQLSRCHDVYRLAKLTRDVTYSLDALANECYDMVQEVENESD